MGEKKEKKSTDSRIRRYVLRKDMNHKSQDLQKGPYETLWGKQRKRALQTREFADMY